MGVSLFPDLQPLDLYSFGVPMEYIARLFFSCSIYSVYSNCTSSSFKHVLHAHVPSSTFPQPDRPSMGEARKFQLGWCHCQHAPCYDLPDHLCFELEKLFTFHSKGLNGRINNRITEGACSSAVPL